MGSLLASAARPTSRVIAEIRESTAGFQSDSAATLRSRAEQCRELLLPARAAEDSLRATVGGLAAEALRRSLGVELFDVQLRAGLALAHNVIVEMQTGEGKTFAGYLAAVWHGLSGRGAHVATANSYLAGRDCELLRPAFEMLGLSCGTLEGSAAPEVKRSVYQNDIAFGAGHDFGFDYLRDQLQLSQTSPLGTDFLSRLRGKSPERMQRALNYALVDEADQVLLDDAISPLLISGAANEEAADAEIHRQARTLATELEERLDYLRRPAGTEIQLTEDGLRRVNQRYPGRAGAAVLFRPWSAYVENALHAAKLMVRDVHYIVENGALRIVDESTGRIFDDRTWRAGLHQAVEAREGLTITAEKQPLAQISRQALFRRYRQLSGMTGTAAGSEAEFLQIYHLPVVAIAPRLPSRRQLFPTRFFPSAAAKRNAIVSEAETIRRRGRPVLIGTRSIHESLNLSAQLRAQGVDHQVLNGRQDAEEAAIIAAAGDVGCVTIATNLAGRGTDIRLSDQARAHGGLHVIATEPYESSRVDRQLIGRSARQGDPGSARLFVSPADTLLVRHAPWLGQYFGTQATATSGTESWRWERLLSRLQLHLEQQAAASRRSGSS